VLFLNVDLFIGCVFMLVLVFCEWVVRRFLNFFGGFCVVRVFWLSFCFWFVCYLLFVFLCFCASWACIFVFFDLYFIFF